MYKSLKEGWIPLPTFEKENNLKRWETIKLTMNLQEDFKEKIGSTWVVREEQARAFLNK
jgi:hypothetical protein